MRAHLFLLISLAISPVSFAETTPEVMTLPEALQRGLLTKAVSPQYSYEARALRKRGSGVFDLRFDYETGHLQEIHIVRPLPDPLLRNAAIDALKQWHAKPRSIHVLRLPVTFLDVRVVLGGPIRRHPIR
jgi:outer membrane biosynthesis protein TonB